MLIDLGIRTGSRGRPRILGDGLQNRPERSGRAQRLTFQPAHDGFVGWIRRRRQPRLTTACFATTTE
jgi:hypothetical protein